MTSLTILSLANIPQLSRGKDNLISFTAALLRNATRTLHIPEATSYIENDNVDQPFLALITYLSYVVPS